MEELGMFKKALLYWHTLRYLKPSQPLWRCWHKSRRRFHLYWTPRTPALPPPFDQACARRLKDFLACCNDCNLHAKCNLDDVRNQAFCFLGRPMENEKDIPWRDHSYPMLWRYKLHGFCFGRDFAINAVADNYLGDRDRVLNWMRDWIARNPADGDAGWDAWPVSERLLHWSLLISVFHLYDTDIRAAYLRQLHWLEKWIEYDLRANHLLKNTCALATAACLAGDTIRLLRAVKLLELQIAEQILPDGGHFERSPMYHAHALWDCLLVYAALDEKPPFLEKALTKMSGFLKVIVHPDGEIPLFGDSALNEAPPTQALLGLAQHLLSQDAVLPAKSPPRPGLGVSLADSGFYILGNREKGHHMIVKTAPPMPSYQPGHSHADMLSYELSLNGRRIIIDSGVHGYAESALRGYCRSTRAHNTVQLDALEQCECWQVFRIGQRSTGDTPLFTIRQNIILLEAECRHPLGYRHCRCIQYLPDRQCWEVKDTVEVGSGSHEIKSRVHLHPDIQVACGGNTALLYAGSINCRIALCSEGTLAFNDARSSGEENWYCPEFGQSYPSPAITMRCHGTSPLSIAYTISID